MSSGEGHSQLLDTGLSTQDVVHALIAHFNSLRLIWGGNGWREQHEGPCIARIDEELAHKAGVYAPTKPGVGDADNPFAVVHFPIMLASLQNKGQAANNPALAALTFDRKEAREYFQFLDDVAAHLEWHHQLKRGIDWLIEHPPQDAQGLTATIRTMRAEVYASESPLQGFFEELAGYVSANPGALYDQLQAMKPLTRRYADFFESAFASLPLTTEELGPVCRTFLGEANRNEVPGSAAPGNHLVGRLLQAFYADERGVPYADVGLEPRARQYFRGETGQGETVYQRTLKYFNELSRCPLWLDENGNFPPTLSGGDMIRLYAEWYRKMQVVEFVTPQFTGAAENAAMRFLTLLNHLKERTDGAVDLTGVQLSETAIQAIQAKEDTLRVIGRMAMAMDAIGHDPERPHPMNGEALRTISRAIWGEELTQQTWGSPNRYIPSESRGFASFRQDVATALYANSLLLEYHGERVPDGVNESLATDVRALAFGVLECADSKALQTLMTDHGATVLTARNAALNLASSREYGLSHCAEGIHFIATHFGLESLAAVPISEHAIRAGLRELRYDGERGMLHISYQEAEQRITFSIPVAPGVEQMDFQYVPQPYHDRAGLIYPAHIHIGGQGMSADIPVVGRLSYDPMGETGNPHGGGIIGFGCSMHHATLQYVLAVAGALGATEESLENVRARFMSTNAELHARHDLSRFQVAQVESALQGDIPVSYREWISRNGEHIDGEEHAHTRAFIERGTLGERTFARAARLQMGYPDLYPASPAQAQSVDPRRSFYHGEDLTQVLGNGAENRIDVPGIGEALVQEWRTQVKGAAGRAA